MITFKQIKESKDIKTYIERADISLNELGYTEHSFAHVGIVAKLAGDLLKSLKYDQRTIELTQIAAYMHDIGNVINRIDHAQSGAVMAFRILDKMGMPAEDIAAIVSAIGNHDEDTAYPVNEIAASLIIADKTDVRRSRVRNKQPNTYDIHDRVNHAVSDNKVTIDVKNKSILQELTIDNNTSSVMDYFEIYLHRVQLTRKAAAYFNMEFHLAINGMSLC